MPRLFNALSGSELKEVVLRTIAAKLDEDHRFRANITYPTLEFDLKFHLKAYPMEPSEATIVLGSSFATENASAAALGEPVVVDFGAKSAIEAPDALREQLGMPVPQPHVGAGGQIVDEVRVATAPTHAKAGRK